MSFFEVFKIKTVLSVITPIVVRCFGGLVVAKIDFKVVACSFETLTNSEGSY
jgi:hypothetical protein